MSGLLLRLFTLCVVAALMPSPAVGAANDCFDLEVDASGMRVSVEIAGREHAALLTTDYIGFTLPYRLAEELQLVQYEYPSLVLLSDVGEPRKFHAVRDLPISLFGFDIEAERVMVVDSATDLLTISLRVIEDRVIQLDFPNHKICFASRDLMDLRRLQNIELDSDSVFGTPAVRVTLNNDFETWLTLTPEFAGGLLVDELTARSLGFERENDPQDPDSPVLHTVIDSLKFGPYELGNIDLQYPRDDVRTSLTTRQPTLTGTRVRRGRATRGRLGIDILKHFVITLDLEREHMHVYAP